MRSLGLFRRQMTGILLLNRRLGSVRRLVHYGGLLLSSCVLLLLLLLLRSLCLLLLLLLLILLLLICSLLLLLLLLLGLLWLLCNGAWQCKSLVMSLSRSLLDCLLRTLLDEHIAASIGCGSAEDDWIPKDLRLNVVRCPKLTQLTLNPRGRELHLLRSLLLERTQQLCCWHGGLRDLNALLPGRGSLLLS